METSMPNPAPEARAPTFFGFFKAVSVNLREGARVAYFRPFSGDVFQVGAWHMLALAVIDVAISIVYDYVSVEPERHFSTYGFMDVATAYLLFVFAVFAIASISSDKGGTPRIIVIILSAGPAVSLVALPLTYAGLRWEEPSLPLALLVGLLLPAWGLAILYRVFSERYETRKAKTVVLVLFFVLLSEGPRLFLDEAPFWYSFNPEDYADTESVNTEDVYYSQPALLERSANRVEAQRPGITDLYFVGFGSYANQDVFMHEVNYVRNLFDTQFDTRGRSVVLINNQKTVNDVPLANKSNLRIMLDKVAAHMDTEEDVLFLFLTSHGSDDAVLSVDFWPLDLNPLSADDLNQALAGSGIKWRIVVISACYSGSFIESLRDNYTLILTAAEKDKTSFGCSNDRNMTYFGEHYFARALPASGSFVDAFHRAKAALREREIDEKIDPSEPQMFMGKAMGTKLAALEARLRNTPTTMAQAPVTRSRDCGEDAPLAREGFSTVRGKDVVENREIACLPGKDDVHVPVR